MDKKTNLILLTPLTFMVWVYPARGRIILSRVANSIAKLAFFRPSSLLPFLLRLEATELFYRGMSCNTHATNWKEKERKSLYVYLLDLSRPISMCKTARVCKNVRFSVLNQQQKIYTARFYLDPFQLYIRKMIFPVFNNVFGIWLNLAKGQIIVDKKILHPLSLE